MNGKQAWASFAKAQGIQWEEGPIGPRDQHGQEYYTLIGDEPHFENTLKRMGCAYVIVRMFPHPATDRKLGNLIRMRFSSYAQKPAEKTT